MIDPKTIYMIDTFGILLPEGTDRVRGPNKTL